MRDRGRARLKRRGVTLALVALILVMVLGLSALAIDLGMIQAASDEAQRAADAAALAGASAFIDYAGAAQMADTAKSRALTYATANSIRHTPIVAAEVAESVKADTIWVTVHRNGVPTWFANTFGVSSANVKRRAAATASAGQVSQNCIKPFLLVDLWHESDKTNQDLNSNDVMDGATGGKNGGEQWFYEPNGTPADRYQAWNPDDPSNPNATGYGSGHAGFSSDRGLPILIKPQTGNAQRQGNWYYTLDGPGHNLRDDIENGCINANVGDTPNYASGGKTGQARQGVNYLVGEDPGASWDNTTKQVVGSNYADWTQSPRVIVVGLMDPIYVAIAGGKKPPKNDKPDPNSKFSNFARVFLEQADGNENISARFIGFASGGAGGSGSGGALVVCSSPGEMIESTWHPRTCVPSSSPSNPTSGIWCPRCWAEPRAGWCSTFPWRLPISASSRCNRFGRRSPMW